MTDAIILDKNTANPRFVYAGFWIRFLAFIIDMAVVNAVNSIVHMVVGEDFNLFLTVGLYDVIFWVSALLYFTLMTYFTNGQTLGKMITNLRVISIYGGKLSLGQVVSRETFGRFVQNKLMFLYLIVPFAPKKQSLFDMFADTAVVRIDAYNYVNDSISETL